MISVVTAYYNRKKLFQRTLESMKPNYGKIDFEVIAVDDGSEEDERLEDLQVVYPFLRVIRLEKEDKWYKNSCIPFNTGFRAAKGDKIIIQNPECYHFGDILYHVHSTIIDNKYLSFGCFSLDEENTQDEHKLNDRTNISDLISKNQHVVKHDGALGWYNHSVYRPEAFHFCAAMGQKELLQLGGFDEQYALGVGYDDNEFIWRIKQKHMEIIFVDDAIVLHQNHYNDNSVSISQSQKDELYKRNKFIFENFTRLNLPWRTNTSEINLNQHSTNEEREFSEIMIRVNNILPNKKLRKALLYVVKLFHKFR